MATTFDSTINSLYLGYYGRPADPAGLAFWAKSLTQANGNLDTVVTDFAKSAETTLHFGDADLSARVTSVYQQIFGRAPDAAGLAYWTEQISSGKVSIAGAALDIMHGAQTSDATVSQMRLDAAAKFTAQVAESGSGYDGDAAVTAGNLLINAIQLNTSAADIENLVTASTKLADIATHSPEVISAIALNVKSMSELLGTERGKADPVTLVQTLSKVAEAAAGSASALSDLLRGGGMGKVLTVMPKTATLHDVQDALKTGGIAAAVKVVYPEAPSAPAVTPPVTPHPTLDVTLQSITHDDLDRNPNDNVTNKSIVDATFSFSGKQLASGQHFEYSVNGTNWTSAGVTASASAHTVTLHALDLSGHPLLNAQPMLNINSVPANSTTQVQLRIVDNATHQTVATSGASPIVYDRYAKSPGIELVHDTHHGDSGFGAYDNSTTDGQFNVTGQESGGLIEYTTDNPYAASNSVVFHPLDLTAGDPSIPADPTSTPTDSSPQQGNQSPQDPATSTDTNTPTPTDTNTPTPTDTNTPTPTDTNTPTPTDTNTPTPTDTNTPTPTDTNTPTPTDTNTPTPSDPNAGAGSSDSDNPDASDSDTPTPTNPTPTNPTPTNPTPTSPTPSTPEAHWSTSKPALVEGDNTFWVRQTDAAGNVSIEEVHIKIDHEAPTAVASLTLANDTGTSTDHHATGAADIALTGLDTAFDTAWEYSLDNGKSWKYGDASNGTGQATLHLTDLADGQVNVQVREFDGAGNVGAASQNLTFAFDHSTPTTGGGGIGGPAPALHVTPSPFGVIMYSDLPGTWQMVTDHGVETVATAPSSFPIPLPFPNAEQPVGQGHVMVGKLQVTSSDNVVMQDTSDAVYTLGTDQGDTMTGQFVFGFGGNDHLVASYSAVVVNDPVDGDSGPGMGNLAGSYLLGGDGNDVIEGGSGTDLIMGGNGADLMSGGAGHDIFVILPGESPLETVGHAAGYDTISDFEVQVEEPIMGSSGPVNDITGDKLVLALGQQFTGGNGITLSTTTYDSLAEFLADANAMVQNGAVTNIIVGQVGFDTFVLGYSPDSLQAKSFDSLNDTVVKLANTSAEKIATHGVMSVTSSNSSPVFQHLGSDQLASFTNGDDVVDVSSDTKYVNTFGGNDTIHGSQSGGEYIVGGAGGDVIWANMGETAVTLGYGSAADSNLSSLNVQGASASYDEVHVSDWVATNFHFAAPVDHVYTSTSEIALTGSTAAAVYAELTRIYQTNPTGAHDALYVRLADATLLVANNGDNVIDGNDVIVKLVGSGGAHLGVNGDVSVLPPA